MLCCVKPSNKFQKADIPSKKKKKKKDRVDTSLTRDFKRGSKF